MTTRPLRLRAGAPGQDAPKKTAEGMDARDRFLDGGGQRIRTCKVAAKHQALAPVRVVRPTKGGQEAPPGNAATNPDAINSGARWNEDQKLSPANHQFND